MTDEFDDDLDFTPAVEPTGRGARRARRAATGPGRTRAAAQAPAGKPAKPRKGTWRRRLASTVILAAALVGSGLGYALFASTSGADETAVGDAEAGRLLYNTSCIACHGANLEGVEDRGPTLIGVG